MFYAKYRELKGWIPATDVDEIDAAKDYARDVVNVDFENGFIYNTAAPTLMSQPSVIEDLLEEGWDVLVCKYYYHSTQGNIFFRVLYKEDEGETHLLKFFVNETELNIDEINEDVTFATKPTNISFNLVNDQLKINLNVVADYQVLEKQVIANLTLVYLDTKSYIDEGIERLAGWYLFPRWLGWSVRENITLETDAANAATEWEEDFEDALDPDYISLVTSFTVGASTYFSGNSAGFYNNSTDGLGGLIVLGSILNGTYRNIRKLSFDWAFGYLGEGRLHLKITKVMKVNSDDFQMVESSYFYTKDDEATVRKFEFDLNILGSEEDNQDSSIYIWVGLPGKGLPQSPFVEIDNIKIEGFEGVLLTKNSDGQRSLVVEAFDLPLMGDYNIKFDESLIDWRIAEYELYIKYNEVFILWKTVKPDGEWALETTDLVGGLSTIEEFEDDVTVLAFNYGLGATVKVFGVNEDGLVGDYIYREVFYRGRSYYVKGDSYVYHSHLSGTGRPQPDSFPFDEDVSFGFVITYSDEINKALAITLLDELIIGTEKKNYVYTIESSAGTPFRRLKAVNGGAGILNASSLITELNGASLAKMLIWYDDNAVYAYVGGREIPMPITGMTHRNFWRTMTGKNEAVIIYNKAKNEYWIQIFGMILIYEIDTNSWKKYEYDFLMKEYVGVVDGKTYVLSVDNKLYKLDPDSNVRLEGKIEFHDNVLASQSGESVEIQTKVLQDIYLLWKGQSSYQEMVTCEIIVDENELDEIVYFPIYYKRYTSRSPLLVTFGRIRFRLTIPANSPKFRELGYAYTILPIYDDGILNDLRGIGMEVGGEHGVVF